MNRRQILNTLMSLTSLFTVSVAVADIKLAADFVPGASSSLATPVGRASNGLLVVAKNSTGEPTLLIAREPSGSFETVKTLSPNSSGFSATGEGEFFSIPSGLPLAGTTWFTDGTAAGTFQVPFAKSDIFQQNGVEILFSSAGVRDLHRFNLSTSRLEAQFITSNYDITAVINETAIQYNPDGTLYYFNRATKNWVYMTTLAYQAYDRAIYTGANKDRLYIAGARWLNTYVYQIFTQNGAAEVGLVSALPNHDYYTKTPEVRRGVAYVGATPYEAFLTNSGESYTIEPYQKNRNHFDTFVHNTTLPGTYRGTTGFVADTGRIYSLASFNYFDKRVAHEPLTFRGESVTVSSLRIVGDSLLIFGSTPSLGSEVWTTAVDSCPTDTNKLYPGLCACGTSDVDSDLDGTPNCGDACSLDPLKTAPGACGCGILDTDSDGDGRADCQDLCPSDAQKLSPGACGCGIADTDSDGDGTPDCADRCDLDPKKVSYEVCGCGVVDADSDSDGILDCHEGCPTDSRKAAPGVCGCNVPDTDSDGDRFPDCADDCPQDPKKFGKGICGCGIADTDSDGDLTPDCFDRCPFDTKKTAPGNAGCGLSELDSDGDLIPDAIDLCPADMLKTKPGACGCGVQDEDRDRDGVADCKDTCSTDDKKSQAGVCGCGVADTDSDKDGTADCFDLCPLEATLTSPTNGSCERQTAVVDLCPQDFAKTTPGVCGCGIADTDSDGDGIKDCHEPSELVASAPTVRATSTGKTARLTIQMTRAQNAAYVVELTRLDKRGGKAIVRTLRSPTGIIGGIPSKSRLAVRYRIVSARGSGEWSPSTVVRVK